MNGESILGEGEKLYSTGRLSKMFGVAPRTISQWIDKGLLVGFKIPGSQDRRVTRTACLNFCREHGYPIPFEVSESVGLAYALRPGESLPEFLLAPTAFEFARILTARRVVAVVVGDGYGMAEAIAAATHATGSHGARAAVVLSEENPAPEGQFPFTFIRRPCDLAAAVRELIASARPEARVRCSFHSKRKARGA